MSRIKGLVLVAAVTLTACGAAKAQTPAKPETPAKAGVAAYVGNEEITLADLDAKILKTNMTLAQSLYDARKAMIDQLVVERVLGPDAAKRGVTADQILSEKIAEKVAPVTDAEVQSYYEGNKGRMGGKTLEQTSAQIKSFLGNQRQADARNTVIRQIKEQAGVRVTLDAPRVEVPLAANDPVKGPANAKVTIVEFSEFQ